MKYNIGDLVQYKVDHSGRPDSRHKDFTIGCGLINEIRRVENINGTTEQYLISGLNNTDYINENEIIGRYTLEKL